MTPLPFTLRMPGQDHSADGITAWSAFTVHGVLRFEEGELRSDRPLALALADQINNGIRLAQSVATDPTG